MNRSKWIFFASWLGLVFLIQACSSATSPTTTTPATGLTCTATATVFAGTPTVPNIPIQISGLNVQIGNDTTGPFTIQVQGLPAISTPYASFIDPNIETILTSTSGGVSAVVTVLDVNTQASGTCTLSIGTGTTTGSGDITVTPSTATTTVGAYSGITLTASSASVANPSFTFQPVASGEPIQITQLSPTSAYVASNTAGTFAIIVTLNGYGTSVQKNVTFTGTSGGTTGTTTGGSVGGGQIIISASQTSGPAGQWLNFYPSATGLINPEFTFTVAQSKGYVHLNAISGGVAITSYAADQPIIQVTAQDYTGASYYTTFQLNFY